MFRTAEIALAIGMFAFASTGLVAQELTKPFVMNIMLPCNSKVTMTDLITKQFGEQPFTQSNGSMFPFTGNKTQMNKLPGVVKVWANPTTWTFSVTIEDPSPENDIMCMLTKGTNLKPTAQEGSAL